MISKVQDATGNWWLELEERAHSMATPNHCRVFFGSEEPTLLNTVVEQTDDGRVSEYRREITFNHGVTVEENDWQEIVNSCAYGLEYTVSGRPALPGLVRRSDERQRVAL